MDWTIVDVINFLFRWEQDSPPLFVVLKSPEFNLRCIGKLESFSPAGAHISWGKREGLFISFKDASFSYAKTENMPSEIRVVSEERFLCALTIVLPSGLSFAILEMWSA